MEQEAQPHKSDQHELGEKRAGTMAKPLIQVKNKGILPGFQTVGMSRKLEVHYRSFVFNFFVLFRMASLPINLTFINIALVCTASVDFLTVTRKIIIFI